MVMASKKGTKRRKGQPARAKGTKAAPATGTKKAPPDGQWQAYLDPRLGVTAGRAKVEARGTGSLIPPAAKPPRGRARARRGVLPARGRPPETGGPIVPAATEVRPPGTGSLIVPARSVSNLSIGRQCVLAQSSRKAAAAFERDDVVPVLIDTADRTVEQTIKAWGGTSRRLSASTIVARAPRTRLAAIARMAAVNYVEANTKLRPHCDLAHASARLSAVAGARTVPERGRHVLIGVVDTGIDASHPAFQAGGKTRLVEYHDQITGKTYSPAEINRGDADQAPDEIGHGTHVAGIAAGNGAGAAQSRYAGVAPEAELAIVKTTFDSTDIADAVARIFEIAKRRKRDCVVNLSLGGHAGPHDGSSVIERTIDQLCDAPGRIVVASAGNEGDTRVHAGTVLKRGTPEPARWVADIEVTSQVVDGTLMGLLFVQVWHKHEDHLVVRLRSPNGEMFAAPAAGRQETDRGTFAVSAEHQIAPYSGDNSTTFGIFTIPENKWLKGWSVVVEEVRKDDKTPGVLVGAVHAWIPDESMGFFKDGFGRGYLVGMPGTSFSAVTVASYATRGAWKSADPTRPDVTMPAVNLENISYFSSPGPNRDRLNKPEVAAPGQWLISALSSQASEDEMPPWLRMPGSPYAALQGTSMAAPYVAGAIALLLERHPHLYWSEVKRRLIKSTREDEFTYPCWNERWGWGKMNVERLLGVDPSS